MEEELKTRGMPTTMNKHGSTVVMSYSWFITCLNFLNAACKKALLGDEFVSIQFDPWATQAECGICTALKVMKQRAIATGNKSESRWLKTVMVAHKMLARLERLTYHQ